MKLKRGEKKNSKIKTTTTEVLERGGRPARSGKERGERDRTEMGSGWEI